jgi:hypothetical protein
LIAPPDVVPLVDPARRQWHCADGAIECEQRLARSSEDAVVDDERIRRLLRCHAETMEIRVASTIDDGDGLPEVVEPGVVAFAAREDASRRARVERREHRPQVTQDQHVGVEKEETLCVDHAGGRIEHRLAHRIDARSRLASDERAAVLRNHALARRIAVQREHDDRGILTAAVRVHGPQHVVEQVFEPGRDDRRDRAFGTRPNRGNRNLGAS